MIFNFSDNYQFSTWLKLDNVTLETVNETKLLGVIITKDLKWDANTQYLVKKANQRMQLLRKIASFGASLEEKKEIYVLYIRSILEKSCTVWHSKLTEENETELERVQKAAVRIILNKSYENYEDALEIVNLQKLKKEE